MGMALRILGILIGLVGFALMFTVMGILDSTAPDFLRPLREWWDGIWGSPDSSLDARVKNALAVIFVLPGLALFYWGKEFDKPKEPPPPDKPPSKPYW